MKRLIACAWVLWLVGLSHPAVAADDAPIVDRREALAFLDRWTGHWRGRFTVYSQSGEVVTALDVEQRYRWDGEVQRATFREVDAATGAVVTADARNYVDDTGRLVCEVKKSNGESSRHLGRVEDGRLFWFANEPGRVETFVEAVIEDERGRAYTIAGFGMYGTGEHATHFVFDGRYEAVVGE
ncbi:MAG: hypothetical protein AAF078_09080 [Planctomycetota bacterium]